jgi:hypothetical protein
MPNPVTTTLLIACLSNRLSSSLRAPLQDTSASLKRDRRCCRWPHHQSARTGSRAPISHARAPHAHAGRSPGNLTAPRAQAQWRYAFGAGAPDHIAQTVSPLRQVKYLACDRTQNRFQLLLVAR